MLAEIKHEYAISLIESLQYIPDPRIKGLVKYQLDEILFLAISAIISGMQDMEEISFWGTQNLEWLRKFLPYKNGVAAEQTLARVLRAIDHKKFKVCFNKWAENLCTHIKGVIAIDGKTSRGSKLNTDGFGALHTVSAFAHNAGIVLAQEAVKEKSNEIKAIPELLETLSIEGNVITIDAMGTQTEIAKKIVSKKGDYVLALKGNHKELFDDVSLFFDDRSKEVRWNEAEHTDAGHGRVEGRKCIITSDIDWLKKRHPGWSNLNSIIKIEASRFNKKTKHESKENRYYISSIKDGNATEALEYTRAHWSVEAMHWTLDVTFRDDSSRARKGNVAANLLTIRTMAFNMLKADKSGMSRKTKLIKAALNPDYRLALLTGDFLPLQEG